METIEAFIANYGAAGFERIRFAWNGQDGAQFGDLNLRLRKDVLATVLHTPYAVPIELIRDLFVIETEVSRLFSAVDEAVGDLATVLLNRGRGAALLSFLHGGTQSLDAYYECLTATILPGLASELAEQVSQMLETIDNPEARTYLEGMLAFFRSKSV